MSMIANLLALALIAAEGPPTPPAPPTAMPKIARPRRYNPEPAEPWNLSLRDAIRIGLDNSETIRVIRLGAQSIPVGGFEPMPTPLVDPADRSSIIIAPLAHDASLWDFRADVMAHVRSIEQQYWALWGLHAALGAREAAIREGEAALARERENPGGESLAVEVAEAERRLEDLKMEMVSVTSDLIRADRQLRNILGLPPEDHRRIIPATPPTRARVEPDRGASLREMLESHPGIVRERLVARLYELQLLLARNQLLPILNLDELHQLDGLGSSVDKVWPGLEESVRQEADRRSRIGPDSSRPDEPEFIARQVGLVQPMPIGFGRVPLANTRQAQYRLIRQRAALRGTIDRSTDALSGFFEEIGAGRERFEDARRVADEAGKRLEARRGFYNEGRVGVDRLLDAIGLLADAVAAEAEHLADYNAAIAAMEESKGTLLASDGVEVADRPRRRKPYVRAKDAGVTPASAEKAAGPAPVASP